MEESFDNNNTMNKARLRLNDTFIYQRVLRDDHADESWRFDVNRAGALN